MKERRKEKVSMEGRRKGHEKEEERKGEKKIMKKRRKEGLRQVYNDEERKKMVKYGQSNT